MQQNWNTLHKFDSSRFAEALADFEAALAVAAKSAA